MIWETVIGLETHVELSTASKLFCSCAAAFGGEPNTRCCLVCMGLPGALPVLNERAVELAARAALALGCTVAGYLLQNAALEGLSARTVALLQCTCPVMTAAFSYFLLGETLSPAGLAGAGIILACVVAETVMKEEAPPEEASEK